MKQITRFWKVSFLNQSRTRFLFSRNQQKKHSNPNYQHMQKKNSKNIENEEEKQPARIVKFDHDIMLRNLILANMTLGIGLPFFHSVNAAILVMNGGYFLGRLGHQIKQFLIIIGNKHYQQIKGFRKPHFYLKLILQSLLFLSVASISLAFEQYTVAHGISILWLGHSIYREIIPQKFIYLSFAILFVIFFNALGPSIKKIVMPTPVDAFLAKSNQNQSSKLL